MIRDFDYVSSVLNNGPGSLFLWQDESRREIEGNSEDLVDRFQKHHHAAWAIFQSKMSEKEVESACKGQKERHGDPSR